MVVAFPAEDEVAVLLVGPHKELDPEVNVCTRLYEALGIGVPPDERRKPPCCEDVRPPVDAELVDRFIEGSQRLRRSKSRRKRRRSRRR
jgi:hypothetical protein